MWLQTTSVLKTILTKNDFVPVNFNLIPLSSLIYSTDFSTTVTCWPIRPHKTTMSLGLQAYQFTNKFFRRMSKWLHLLHDIEDTFKPLPFDVIRVRRLFRLKLLDDALHQLMLALIASVLFSRDLIPMTLQPTRILHIAKYVIFNPMIPIVVIWVQLWSIPHQIGLSHHL